jgi:hypothetical protein
VPIGWAISGNMTTRYSQAELERLRRIIYEFYDEFRDHDITEADIYSFVGAGLLDEWLEPPANR